MNPLRKKLNVFLTDAVYRGMETLEPDQLGAEVLEKIDIDSIIKKDIAKFCEAVSFTETARIFSLAARLKISTKDKRRDIKKELKGTAETIVKRAEDEFGKLNIPEPCRQLLLNL